MKVLWILASALCALTVLAPAEIVAPRPLPPQAMPVSVEVKRGEPVEITLRAYGRATQQLRFKLRSLPALGKIADLKVTSADTATLVYQHEGAAEPARDRFTYVVQSAAGVSAPAEVEIKITDEPPLLVVMDEVDFGKVTPGVLAAREITVENRGGGLAIGSLAPPENWFVKGAAGYRLDRGETARFTLIFSPTDERTYQGDLRYSSHPDRTTALLGAGVFPIACEPAKLQLTAEKGSAARFAMAALENRMSTAQTVRVHAGRGLQAPEQVQLAPDGKASLRIEAIPEPLGAFESEITISAGDFSVKVPVRVAAVGPILKANVASLTLGKPSADGSSQGELTVENVGGQRAYVRASIAAPFEVAPDDRTLTIEPGVGRPVHVSARTEMGRQLRAMLAFTSPEASLEVLVQAEGAALPRTERQRTASPLMDAPAAAPEKALLYSRVPQIRRWQTGRITRNAAEIRWEAPSDAPLEWRVERRWISWGGGGDLNVEWRAVENIEIKQSGRSITARLRKLQPGALQSFRVFAIDEQGRPSLPSPAIDVETLPRKGWSLRSFLWPLLVVLLALIAWRRFAPERPYAPALVTDRSVRNPTAVAIEKSRSPSSSRRRAG